jgi:hypothetical protein
MHLTLVFLGDCPEPALEAAHESFAALKVASFSLSLQGLGLFGGDRPRVAFCADAPAGPGRTRPPGNAGLTPDASQVHPACHPGPLSGAVAGRQDAGWNARLPWGPPFAADPWQVDEVVLWQIHLGVKAARAMRNWRAIRFLDKPQVRLMKIRRNPTARSARTIRPWSSPRSASTMAATLPWPRKWCGWPRGGLRDDQAPDPHHRRRDDRGGETDLPAERRCLDLACDGTLRPEAGRRGGAEALYRKPGADLDLHPFSRAAADWLETQDVPAYKIGSGEADNLPLIRHIARKGKPVILSTGMQTIETIRASVDILDKAGVDYALLECTNLYPSPARDRQLARRDRPCGTPSQGGRRLFRPFHRAGNGAGLGRAWRLHPGAALYRHAAIARGRTSSTRWTRRNCGS